MQKLRHWFSNIHIYSQVVFSGASWVIECKAFHLVYVCQCWVWKPGPLNVVSAGLLIEPDQFTETASRLAQLPHQRDSNNCTLWPLPSLKKAIFMFASKQAWQHWTHRERRPSLFFHENRKEAAHTYINTTTPNCTLITSFFVLLEWKPIKKTGKCNLMADCNCSEEIAIIPKVSHSSSRAALHLQQDCLCWCCLLLVIPYLPPSFHLSLSHSPLSAW